MKVIVFDTETTNSIEEPLMYDLGFAVIDTDTAEVLATESLAIREVFCDKELMEVAYFADKVPSYWAEIWAKQRKLVNLRQAWAMFRKACKDYDVKAVVAHNARFDYAATATTQRYLTSSKYRYFLPYGVQIVDTLRMAREVFGKDDAYGAFCYENGYLTARGQRRYTAEILYRYLSGDEKFEEVHKGLDDVLIEKEILLACLARGCEMLSPWAR